MAPPIDDGSFHLDELTDDTLIQQAVRLEGAAKELRAAVRSVQGSHYWPTATDVMGRVADDLDRAAIRIRGRA